MNMMMLKMASAQIPSGIWEAEFWVKKKKHSFIALLGKGGHSGIVPSKPVCLNSGGLGEEFYRNGLPAGLLIRISCAGPALL